MEIIFYSVGIILVILVGRFLVLKMFWFIAKISAIMKTGKLDACTHPDRKFKDGKIYCGKCGAHLGDYQE